MLVLFALAIMRIVSASQAGARWRASSPSDDGSAAEDLARRRRVLRATAITGAISGLLMLWTLLRPDHPHRSVSSLPVAVIAWVTVWAALWFALFAVWAMIAWLRRRRRSQ
jgi:cobalamin synthase